MEKNNGVDILISLKNYCASIEFCDADDIIIDHFMSWYPYIKNEHIRIRELNRLNNILSEASYELLLKKLEIHKLNR